jgi:uncharacterized membrane protein YebE (DUF533 family)
VADDDDVIQVTTPLLQTFVRPVASSRTVAKIRGLAPVSQVANALQAFGMKSPAERHAASPTTEETHELLTPQTAAALTQMHAVEAELMIRAMIEAAKADGQIDAEERRRILTCLRDAGTADADRDALIAAMSGPPDLDGLVARVTNPELAREVYAASLLAIEDDQPSEQLYLARLADRLKLAPEVVAELHARFNDPPPLPSGS